MHQHPFWISKIEHAWQRRPIVWLSGARRVGKTTLAKMLSDAVYMNCDLSSVGRRRAGPESFFDGVAQEAIVVLDEIHQMADPSRLLKTAADGYPHLRMLAAGSSTLAATKKFRDSLTGRKQEIYLPPVLWQECRESFSMRIWTNGCSMSVCRNHCSALTRTMRFFQNGSTAITRETFRSSWVYAIAADSSGFFIP